MFFDKISTFLIDPNRTFDSKKFSRAIYNITNVLVNKNARVFYHLRARLRFVFPVFSVCQKTYIYYIIINQCTKQKKNVTFFVTSLFFILLRVCLFCICIYASHMDAYVCKQNSVQSTHQTCSALSICTVFDIQAELMATNTLNLYYTFAHKTQHTYCF